VSSLFSFVMAQEMNCVCNKKFWEELFAYFLLNDTDSTRNEVSNNSSIVAYAFVARVTFLPSRCLATKVV
jgi:hypothetical protein